jgi:phosphopantothenoylcysteine decarboxylase / phosphopantothenate---cysteine ligase
MSTSTGPIAGRHSPARLDSLPASSRTGGNGRRLLITAGPTYEPIDAVRFLGNRSSGRLGIALADAAAETGWDVCMLLGPVSSAVTNSGVTVRKFRTCDDLDALLKEEAPKADVLIMAAAVADYRPKPNPAMSGGKFRRTNTPLMLELEPTPDLLAGVSSRRKPGQFLVGFALEPRADLLSSAKSKLERKGVDLVVANPLETMDSDDIEAILVGRDGSLVHSPGGDGAKMSKRAFVRWLLEELSTRLPAAAARK